jgi:hypothetical protein
LPDDLLRRVRVRCAETGVRQNVFVERALESALGGVAGMAEVPPAAVKAGASSRASVPDRPPKLPAGVRSAREVAAARQAALNKAKKS